MKTYSIGYYDCECGGIDILLRNEKEYTELQFIDLIRDVFSKVEKADEDYDPEDNYELSFEFAIDDIVTMLINEFGFIEQEPANVVCRFNSDATVNNFKTLE